MGGSAGTRKRHCRSRVQHLARPRCGGSRAVGLPRARHRGDDVRPGRVLRPGGHPRTGPRAVGRPHGTAADLAGRLVEFSCGRRQGLGSDHRRRGRRLRGRRPGRPHDDAAAGAGRAGRHLDPRPHRRRRAHLQRATWTTTRTASRPPWSTSRSRSTPSGTSSCGWRPCAARSGDRLRRRELDRAGCWWSARPTSTSCCASTGCPSRARRSWPTDGQRLRRQGRQPGGGRGDGRRPDRR